MREQEPLPLSAPQHLSGESPAVPMSPKERQKQSRKRYAQTEKGKAANQRYAQSEKGKAANERYSSSDKGKQAQNESSKRWNRKHRVPKGTSRSEGIRLWWQRRKQNAAE